MEIEKEEKEITRIGGIGDLYKNVSIDCDGGQNWTLVSKPLWNNVMIDFQ